MTEFKMLDDRGAECTIQCPRGHVFEVDACLEENLMFHPRLRALVPTCPTCGLVDAPGQGV